jgi:hypothetical protein
MLARLACAGLLNSSNLLLISAVGGGLCLLSGRFSSSSSTAAQSYLLSNAKFMRPTRAVRARLLLPSHPPLGQPVSAADGQLAAPRPAELNHCAQINRKTGGKLGNFNR